MSHSTVSSLGEHALITRITARLALPPWVVVGPGDDAAVLRPERGALDVLTTDALVDGVHFDLRFVSPEAAGHRALAANLSDLAAMGAKPRAALLSLLLPDSLDVATIDRVLDGLLGLAARYRVALVGGNITRTPGPLAIDVTATGTVHPRRILTRGGARPGDEVYVTGSVGDAAVGLRVLAAEADLKVRPYEPNDVEAGLQVRPYEPDDVAAGLQVRPYEPDDVAAGLQARPYATCIARYLYPDPRIRAGLLLGRNRAASSCMDLSDGLADAVRQVSTASGAGIAIDAAAIPISHEVRRWHEGAGGNPLETALGGGDDYELLFTVRPANRGRFRAVLKQIGDLPITRIGVVTKEPDVIVRDASGVRDLPPGYEHFRAGAREPLPE